MDAYWVQCASKMRDRAETGPGVPSWARHCLAAPDPALRPPSLFSNQVIKLSGVRFVVHAC